ncbi:CitMHS family citrate-Mg2+:H+ or citrate-Ca2+:H+ symporter [Haloactinospora alba]|uniref:CitMHS family citrate-Mg2+:H+ or citrate-Ca2+:H+ symporter n=1 Tax=Haloactinospora alba TaxID=405555 RepID=A0A543NH41_9ACTN|nr:citrate:proton symporter [Haloactinospora alba]TQN31168.1 CitMHS family citrate-Mg2+:H+ or citrate-Ca2+:H+ symporter [Haloactinospora alba]
MLSVTAFIILVSIAGLLIMGRITPVVGMTVIPLLGALIAGFSISDITGFYEAGIDSVIDVALMLVFAILFFGVMNDIGLFTPLINLMVRVTRGSVVAVAVGTFLVAAVCHLDGSGASTFLICIPALLPLYRRLGMSPYLLMLLLSVSTGILNMLPWGGPVGRAAAVIEMSPTAMWHQLIPVQGIALVMGAAMAALLGLREKKRIAQRAAVPAGASETDEAADEESQEAAPAPGLSRLLFNFALVVAVLTVLLLGFLPEAYVFMIALSIALVANYPKVADQTARIRAHGGAALGTGAIIFAAGSFLGIMQESQMLDALATDVIGFLPDAVLPYLHLIMGVVGAPLELLLSTDAHYFALLPVVDGVVSQFGVDSSSIAFALIIGNIIGTYISPFNASVWLAVGLAGVDFGKHIRYSFLWIWGFSIALLAASMAIGVVGF